MGFQGIRYKTINKSPLRSLNGFYGVKIRFDVASVKINDFRGMGLANVEVTALNPTSGVPFVGYTDRSGSVFMNLDNQTDLIIIKDQIKKTVSYDANAGEISPTYTIDLPMIQNNRSGGWLRDWVELVRSNYTTRVNTSSGTIENEDELLNWLRE